MSEVYLLLTAVVILGSMLVSYQRTRDPLSPLIAFGPMLFYVYVYHPYMMILNGEISRIFLNPGDVEFVFLVDLASIFAFCAGASYYRRGREDEQRFQILGEDVSPRVRRRFFNLSMILGTVSLVTFWWHVSISGGVFRMLSKSKPFLASVGGYLGELPMLTYPALFLLAAAWQGKRLTIGRFLLALYVASPQISWAIVGRRRGTFFLVAAILPTFWYIMNNKKPNWKILIGGVSVIGLFLLFVAANRSAGSVTDFSGDSISRFNEKLTSQGLDTGDEFATGAGIILTSDRFNHHHWGWRYVATFLIRPIPSFLWPSKWTDLGFDNDHSKESLGRMSDVQWEEVVGFRFVGGGAGGFVADVFLEWSWGCVVACFALGFLFSWLWKQWVTRTGVWTVIYIEAMILSVFLPSQSFVAWAYRFVLLAVPTVVVFRLLAPRTSLRQFEVREAPVPTQSF